MDIFSEQTVAGSALVEIDRLAAAQYGNAGHMNVDAAGFELDAGAPGSGEDSAPVRIAACKGGFDERRSRDGLADAARVRFFFGATDFDFNHALGAFTVGNDLQRE